MFEIQSYIFSLKSKYPYRIAHGLRLATDTFVISLQKEGITGYGEATPVPYYGMTTEKMKADLVQYQNQLQTTKWTHPSELWEILIRWFPDNLFLVCALDVAAWDWYGKTQNIRLADLWPHSQTSLPLSNYTIGIDEIPKMIDKLKELDFPIYKIKLGTDQDLQILSAIRVNTSAKIRIDANAAWDLDYSLSLADHLIRFDIEIIEQPFKPENQDWVKILKQRLPIPIIADESCVKESDVAKCDGYFDGINIKLAKCGGITPALRMIEEARKRELLVMMGCMTETSIGVSAIAQFLPQLDYVDMDGALLISNDPAKGVTLKNGKVDFPDVFGIGASLL